MKFIARTAALGGDGPRDIEVEVLRQGTGYRVRIGERWLEADLVSAGPFVRSLRLDDGTQIALTHHREGNTHEISIGGATVAVDIIDPLAAKRRRREDDIGATGVVKAMMPGRVVRVLVAKGDVVRKGAGLLILEAMKMENEITAPADGTVDEMFVEAGQTVESGAELLHIT
ncbi:MAG TPA: biotin/lipoyl-containing protein [Thermoanaerobaculia bacterium]|nr:biotin/lipoyl-containing protein [Thermoanaerobaculia bacterium]